MRVSAISFVVAVTVLLGGCSNQGRIRFATTDQRLGLNRVVLYRNGVGYFERAGSVDGDLLTIKVRKDQVNDLLKSLTVVDRRTGKAVSVSMPLDPQTWANVAMATLAPGRGSLAQVLDSLRGMYVTLETTVGSMEGRVVMVESIVDVPDPTMPQPARGVAAQSLGQDHSVTLLEGQEMHVVRLSKIQGVTLEDGDLAMQFHRSLDATAGEGMFQQVDVAIRLTGRDPHDVVVSYVVSAPMWKPTYRVVLPEGGKGEGLLQGWAVVDNTSGEDWSEVELQLTSGEPIAFRYDLHTPRDVHRTDLTESGVRKRARVAVGETSYEGEDDQSALEEPEEEYAAELAGAYAAADMPAPASRPRGSRRDTAKRERAKDKGLATGWAEVDGRPPAAPPPPPALDIDTLSRSTQARARATQISGLTRFDLEHRVTVPDGTSTMVAVINQKVQAEETFLFKPGGAGTGYEANPYRVVRFRNSTPFVLEPGPISIYSGCSFVGEGLSEAVGAETSATIPFAVEPGIMVSSKDKQEGKEMHLVRIVRGILEVETFQRKHTTWTAKAQTMTKGYTVLIRHPKAGWNYEITDRPQGTEELRDGYLIPLVVPAGKREASLEVVEQTPSRTTLSIWDRKAPGLLEELLLSTNLGADARARLEPIVKVRQAIGRIDTRIDGLKKQQIELDGRAEQTRQNLRAIKKDRSAQAAGLRARLERRLEEFTRDGDRVGREIVELQSKRLEKKIELEDLLQNLDLRAPGKAKGGSKKAPSPAK